MTTMKIEGKLVFVDAQEMHVKFPNTFEAPTRAELSEIKVGDCVKVAIMSERFWILVTELKDGKIIGTVNNDLIFTAEHGLSYSDEVEIEPKNVYAIMVLSKDYSSGSGINGSDPDEVKGVKKRTLH